ncbi:PDR/VanB family oxidoreductase [Spirillospora sp. NPDC127200]
MTGVRDGRAAYESDVLVEARDDLAGDVVALTLAAAGGGDLPGWRPGDHIDLLFGDGLVRQYSLCGERTGGRWRVAVKKEGPGSSHLHDHVREGDRLRVRGPRNHFPFEPSPRYLFLAGGIGITPILPMAAAAEEAGADWTLLYCARDEAALAFRDELARYGDRVRAQAGRFDLDAVLAGPAPGTLVYCCGPEPMLAAVEERCASWPAGTLRTERFTADSVDGSGDALTVELASSGLAVEVPADRSILECLEKAGVQILSSCREGTCGTCETGVLEGVPDHRDAVLTEEERACGEFMMVCVSRATTPRLVLDL